MKGYDNQGKIIRNLRRINEGKMIRMRKGMAEVEKQKFSWGDYRVIRVGSRFSVPIHPEHWEGIKRIADEDIDSFKFKDETGKVWNVSLSPDDYIQFKSTGGTKVELYKKDLIKTLW